MSSNDIKNSSSPPPYQEHASPASSALKYKPGAKDSTQATTRELEFLHTKSHINLRLVDSTSNDAIYYVDNSSFTPGKADVTLCKGSSKEGLVLGVCRWSHLYSKHFAVGIGNPAQDEKSTVWEEVRTDGIINPVYEWSIGPPDSRTTFAWHRINRSDMKVEDENANEFSRKNFRLVNSADGEVLAILTSYRFKSLSKLGKLFINVDGVQRGWGHDWETLLLLSLLGIVEMSRRRGRHRGSQAGPAGG